MALSEKTNVNLRIGTIAGGIVALVLGFDYVRDYQTRLEANDAQHTADIEHWRKRFVSLERYCKAKFEINGAEWSKNYLANHSWYDE